MLNSVGLLEQMKLIPLVNVGKFLVIYNVIIISLTASYKNTPDNL